MAATASSRAAAPTIIGPQPGFQTSFLSSKADIIIGGGAAGCGKTRAAIMGAARYGPGYWDVERERMVPIPEWAAVFFRRTLRQVKNPGGLWSEAQKVYPLLGASPHIGDLEWRWKSGAKVQMAHLNEEATVYDWQGAQVPLFVFDELTHFLASQFWYMLSRNRSTCRLPNGKIVRAKILATCNPDADSWVAELLEWWINQDHESPEYGLPLPERAGKLRFFTRVDDKIIWGNTQQEVIANDNAVPEMIRETMEKDEVSYAEAIDITIRSLTFIPGRLEENKLGDPRYRGNLMALDRVQRARLLGGNWKVRPAAGEYFKQVEAKMLCPLGCDIPHEHTAAPREDEVIKIVRRWDLAATEPSETNKDPDYTCGVKMARRRPEYGGGFVILDVQFARKRAEEVRKLVRSTAESDGTHVRVVLAQDPAQAGKDQIYSYKLLLEGFAVASDPETGDKVTKAEPFAAEWQRGNVYVVRAPWNAKFFSLMEGFPSPDVHDDPVDAAAGAYRHLMRKRSMFD